MVFAELGLLGFLLFIVIMYFIFRQALESMRWFRDVQEHGWMQAIGLGFWQFCILYGVCSIY